MSQKFSLEAAGKLLGVTGSAMRARTKKYPEKYRVERDNSGKIWVWLDPENLADVKVGKPKKSGSKMTPERPIEPAKQVEIVLLEAALSAQVARAEAAEGERDRWRQMADKLADKLSDKLAERPVRRWWPF